MIRNQTGVSLVEIMIAFAIFTLGVSLAMRTLPDSNSATTKSRNMTKATNLAQEKLEALISLQYNDANLSAGTHNDTGNPIDGHYTRSWTVAADTPVTNMKRIQVSVTYPPFGTRDVATLTTTITPGR